jgi:hypothetical protein
LTFHGRAFIQEPIFQGRRTVLVDRYRRWLDRKTVERCAQHLKRNGFETRCVATPEAACREILSMISDFETFGIGGSQTIRQMGITDELHGMGKTIYDHWPPDLGPDEIQAIRLEPGALRLFPMQCQCDFGPGRNRQCRWYW